MNGSESSKTRKRRIKQVNLLVCLGGRKNKSVCHSLLCSACEGEDDQLPNISTFFLLQFSSVAQSCLTLCDPMNYSMPGLPVHHQHLEFTQTQVHQVDDAIQPSHPLSSLSPLALNPSQHQALFQ